MNNEIPQKYLDLFTQAFDSKQLESAKHETNTDVPIEPGQIRPAMFRDADGHLSLRLVLVSELVPGTFSDPRLGVVSAMLIHEHVEMASEDDVLISFTDLGYPLTGAIQTTNIGPVLVDQLTSPVGQLSSDLLDFVLHLNHGGRRNLARTGLLVVDPNDRRIEFANEEWNEMQLISTEAWKTISDPEPAWSESEKAEEVSLFQGELRLNEILNQGEASTLDEINAQLEALAASRDLDTYFSTAMTGSR
jgi:hypothetical protein